MRLRGHNGAQDGAAARQQQITPSQRRIDKSGRFSAASRGVPGLLACGTVRDGGACQGWASHGGRDQIPKRGSKGGSAIPGRSSSVLSSRQFHRESHATTEARCWVGAAEQTLGLDTD